MNGFSPDSYCGIYCGACSIVMRSESGGADALAACLGDLPNREFDCGGCKSDFVYAGCGTCRIRHCAREKGVEHCVSCVDYPCKMYSTWQSVARFLPHSCGAATSLAAIKRDGVGAWLVDQKKHWSCRDCGAPFSWYALVCDKCGRSLASEAFRLTGWRKILCRVVLPMAYRRGKAKRLKA